VEPPIPVNRSPSIGALTTLWTPSQFQRAGLLSAALALLVGVIVASFYGPATVPTYGPLSRAATVEVQALSGLACLSALAAGVATWRIGWQGGLMVGIAGLIGLVAGVYLSFGYWVPVQFGWEAPYTFQGALLMLWGLTALLVRPLLTILSRRALLAPSVPVGAAR
jgi:hypothetical protein